jgi:RNA polymerase sigma-70 factor (ECF subfamily)
MKTLRSHREKAIDSDEQILADLQQGQTRRFRILIDRYKDRALTLAMKILRDRREAEEAVQDAFVKVYRNVEHFRRESSFQTWFFRILYNECFSRLRRNRSVPPMVATEEDEDPRLTDTDAMTDARILSADLQRIISAEFEKLAAHYRTALSLFYLQELKYEEIASVMDVPVGTVKSYIFRGKQVLRKRLGTYEHLEVGAA